MRSVKTSLQNVNRPHPLLMAPLAGLIAVALLTLLLPSGLETAEAWALFVGVSVGVGLGLLLAERRHGNAQDHT